MKYDILTRYRSYLEKNLSKNTAKKYYSSVVNLFRDLHFDSLKEIDETYLKEKLKMIHTKNEFSATKNGLLRLKEFDSSLRLPEDDFFKETSKRKRNHVVNRGREIYVDEVKRKINQISDKKLKLGYRLALSSGLRVSEIAALKKEDIEIDQEGQILITVKNGKGGKSGNVVCKNDPYVTEHLQKYLENALTGQNLFYSASYMEHKAGELEMECHDLRRIYARTYRDELVKDGVKKSQADEVIRNNLRHEKIATTKLYLYKRKIKEKRV